MNNHISIVHIKANFPTIRPSKNKETAKSTFLSAVTSTNVREFVSGFVLAVVVRENV